MDEEKMIPGLGGIASPFDYRDIQIGQVVPDMDVYPDKKRVDISKLPVWYQRKIGACVGHACAKYKQRLDLDTIPEAIPLSARFLYTIAKSLDGYQDEGTYPRLVMKILKDYGCATEKTVPNDTTLSHEAYVYNRNIDNLPSGALNEAKKYKIASYASVPMTKLGIQKAVNFADGLSMLVRLDASWWSDKNGITWDPARILPLKAPNPAISGHQIYVFGYEVVGDDMKVFFLNSFSSDWGNHGEGWFWLSEYQKFMVEGWTAINVPAQLLDEANNLPATFSHNFNRVISYGERSEEVKALQRALSVDKSFNYTVTGYYGDITAAAVLSFQRKYKVASTAELNGLNGKRVGAKTLAKLNELFNK